MKKIVPLLVVLLFSLPLVLSLSAYHPPVTMLLHDNLQNLQKIELELKYGLGELPSPFLKNGSFDGLIVLGSQANGADYLSSVIITQGFENLGLNLSGKGIHDSELANSFKDYNLIVVGNPCRNTLTAQLVSSSDCFADLNEGEGKIKWFKHSNGHVAIIIEGYGNQDLIRAAYKFASFNNLNRYEIVVR